MAEYNNIPKHWQALKVSQIGNLIRGVNYKKEEATKTPTENYLPVLRGNNINGILNFDDLVYVQQKNISEEQLVQKGDIVFAMSSGSKHLVGKSAKAMSDFKGGFGAFCGVFRANETVNKDFIAYFFQSPYYKKVISEISKGTNINNLKREHILDLDFPSPPIPEQQLIVSKIEELLSDLDNGKQQLQTAQQQLKVYRQSLLKWAFEGKLTNKNVKEGELPKGWQWIKSGDLFAFVTSGSRGWAKYYSQSGSIFIRITNMDFDTLELDLKESKIQYVNPLSNSEGIRTKVQEGDFLFSITGYLGMFAIAPKLESAYVNQHVCLCRPKDGFNKKYVGYWIISKSGGHLHLNKNQKGAVKAGLNLDDLKSFPVPLASLEEQQLIVDQLESKLTVCDKIEDTISQSLLQAETLRQSILKQAFEGKLVN